MTILEISIRNKLRIIIGLFALLFLALLFIPAIPQWGGYHNFADSQQWLGIPNFSNVVSNAGGIGVGLFGLMKIYRSGLFDNSLDRLPYVIFFAGVTLVGLGSGYYHWAPSNGPLFWDRLPMTIALMSFFAAVIADRIHKQVGIYFMLPILLIAGVYSLIYWQQTEAVGAGDLRFYGMVQYYPFVAILFIIWLFRDYRYTESRQLLWVMGVYVSAKLFEHFDAEIFNLLGGLVSGHSLKHLVAAVATYMILPMLTSARNSKISV